MKIKAAILGSGNIGMDLLYKCMRSDLIEVTCFIGRNLESSNLARAKEIGIFVSADSIKAIEENPDMCDIVFDATSAAGHREHAPILKKLGKFAIDLTPSHIGKFCIPCLNVNDCLQEDNINMVTCGGQSLVPLAVGLKKVCKNICYIETNSIIASRSAGQGTRANIDEYIQTTADALRQFTGVKNTKSMIGLNPAEPPINMRNTLYIQTDDYNLEQLTEAVIRIETEIKKYVPGYRISVYPTKYDEGIIMLSCYVLGSGDFLPKYSGNLDIITCAAVEVAETYAMSVIEPKGVTLF